MRLQTLIRKHFLLLAIVAIGISAITVAQTAAMKQQATDERDGRHDFDFLFGSWKSHQHRMLHPLSGANDWVDFDATLNVRPLLGGSANVDELKGDAPTGHVEGATFRVYNLKTHEWSIYWANQATGVLSLPATVGRFKDGRGEFFDQEEYNGRTIYVRYLWIASADSPRWEQAFSTDGGKTWETNWTATFTRDKQ